MQAQHIIGYSNGFLLRSGVKKVLDPSKNPKKCQIICFASIQKITSKLLESGENQFLCTFEIIYS